MDLIKEKLTPNETIFYNMLLKQVYYKYEILPTYKQFLINRYIDIIELITTYDKWEPNTKENIFLMLSTVYKLLNKPELAHETSQQIFIRINK